MATLHNSRRVAEMIVATLECPCDPRTVRAWARYLGKSTSAVCAACALANLSAKDVLDFSRVLRAIVLSGDERIDFFDLLDTADIRTRRRLLGRSGLAGSRMSCDEVPALLLTFLAGQTLLGSPAVLDILEAEVARPRARQTLVRV